MHPSYSQYTIEPKIEVIFNLSDGKQAIVWMTQTQLDNLLKLLNAPKVL
jgi:hypothetical protein